MNTSEFFVTLAEAVVTLFLNLKLRYQLLETTPQMISKSKQKKSVSSQNPKQTNYFNSRLLLKPLAHRIHSINIKYVVYLELSLNPLGREP